jgi:hypothetical protein
MILQLQNHKNLDSNILGFHCVAKRKKEIWLNFIIYFL